MAKSSKGWGTVAQAYLCWGEQGREEREKGKLPTEKIISI